MGKFIAALSFAVLALHAQPVLISDTLTTAVGAVPWKGRMTVALALPGQSQPLYYSTTTLTGWQAVYCVGVTGTDCTVTSSAGTFVATLYANSTITPAGTSYTVRVQPDRGGGVASTEIWIVTPATTTLAAVRVTTVPPGSYSFQPSQIAAGGATIGQVMAWNGSAWAPATAGGALTTTAIIDAIATPDGSCVLDTTAVTLTGAALGGRPTLGSSVAWPAAIKIEAKITGPNTVKLEICNHSGASYDPASATYYFGVNQ